MVDRKEIADLLVATPCQRCGKPEALTDLPGRLCFKCHMDNTSAIAHYMDPLKGEKFRREVKEFLTKRVLNGEIPE